MGRLFWKFFFFIFLAQAAAVIGIGTAVWMRDLERQRRQDEFEHRPPAGFYVEAAAEVLRYGGLTALRNQLEEVRHRRIYVVDETSHEVLGRSVSESILKDVRQMLKLPYPPPFVRQVATADGHTYMLFALAAEDRKTEGSPRSFASAAMESPRGRPDYPGLPRPFGLKGPPGSHHMIPYMPMLFGTLASLVSAALLAWYFSKPIRSLRNAFDEAAKGKLDLRLGPTMGRRRDELADLGRDFDNMASQLQTLMDGQRRLLHDVSHELRSPLARLQVAIGLARQRPEKVQSSMDRIERESVSMDKLVGELLTLSQLEAGVMRPVEEDVGMDELLALIIDDARYEAEANERNVQFSGNAAVTVHGSAELLHRAIENVVRNATRHTAIGSTVWVRSRIDEEAKRMRISVLDQGPGVPESELQKIFAPFFRSELKEPTSDGHGLGLAIARRVIETHGGSIQAANRPEGGLCVDIVLPVVSFGTSEVRTLSNTHFPEFNATAGNGLE